MFTSLFSRKWCNLGCNLAVIIEPGQLTPRYGSSRDRARRFCLPPRPSDLIFMVRYMVLFLVLARIASLPNSRLRLPVSARPLPRFSTIRPVSEPLSWFSGAMLPATRGLPVHRPRGNCTRVDERLLGSWSMRSVPGRRFACRPQLPTVLVADDIVGLLGIHRPHRRPEHNPHVLAGVKTRR